MVLAIAISIQYQTADIVALGPMMRVPKQISADAFAVLIVTLPIRSKSHAAMHNQAYVAM